MCGCSAPAYTCLLYTSMQQLVSDLLLLAQLDAGKDAQGGTLNGSEAFALLDFSDVVEAELLQFESVAFERGVQLGGTVEQQIQVRGDASRLHRLMATLLDNACKYADNGGTVTVTLECAGRAAQLAVHNTGPAIAPDDLPHVFDRFYRADKARTRDEGGYGLGLAIAQEIAEEHGGTISATSFKSCLLYTSVVGFRKRKRGSGMLCNRIPFLIEWRKPYVRFKLCD